MNEHALTALEYYKILEMLGAETSCSLGRNLAAALRPETDPDRIRAMLLETTEARRIWEESARPPLGGINDVGAEVERARVGGVLAAEDLWRVGTTLTAARRLREFFADRRDRSPHLWEIAESCRVYRSIEEELARCLGQNGEILDDASPVLRHLRHQMRTLQNRVHDKLESLIRDGGRQKYLQEALVTLRNGRYVIPVKQEYKSAFPGIVHDQSASGATVFVEPMAVVELNNELRGVEAEEQEEVFRILGRLSGLIGDEAPGIEHTLQALARLDLALAKGRLSLSMGGTEPEITELGWLDLRGARHPLLQGNVVPISVELGRDFDTLVITGPNTGGKTVALKTIGLLVLMAQSGLHIPARSGSVIGVFLEVACDIGDEQSIEQSLSTFSSHLTQIIGILARLQGPRTLVLLDELGAGTDPTEGAAMAKSILEYLHAGGVRTVATTHYSELKVFAYQTPGVRNASVEFDVATLRPTYRLMVGLPGRSNAFAIAARLGLPQPIIARAEELVPKADRQVEDLIGSIADDARAAREARNIAEEYRARGDQLRQHYEAELSRLRREKAAILGEARREAREMLLETRRATENLLRLLQEADNGADRREAARAIREEIKSQLDRLGEEDESPEKPAGSPANPDELRPGTEVYSRSLDKPGRILALNGDGTALVQIGIVRVALSLSDLTRQAESPDRNGRAGKISRSAGIGALGRSKAQSINSELDLRGMRVDEALAATDKYLDDLILSGGVRARLIHGKGTGALRQAIGEYLRGHPRIREAHPAAPNEGGAGVTVVELE